jgi:hypothetical protein
MTARCDSDCCNKEEKIERIDNDEPSNVVRLLHGGGVGIKSRDRNEYRVRVYRSMNCCWPRDMDGTETKVKQKVHSMPKEESKILVIKVE